MHVTIETSHRADPTSKIEMLRLGQPSIIITVSVDPEKEPNSSLLIIAEKLVNLDKLRLIQSMSANGAVNASQTVYLNSFEDGNNLQWIECTAARSTKKHGEPLFLVKNPVVYTNTSVYYDKNSGRSYLRVDMSQSVYKRSIEVAKIQFNTCQRDQGLGKHPIYRFVFYQYQNNRLVRDPKEHIPPFVFGTINHGQNVKAIEGYRGMLSRVGIPELQLILKEPEDNGGVSNDALSNGSQDAIIIAARSLANHVSSSSGSDGINRKLTQKERIRVALNSISVSDSYKPLPIPEYLPVRPIPEAGVTPSDDTPPPVGPADAMGMVPVPDAIVGLAKQKRDKANNPSPTGTPQKTPSPFSGSESPLAEPRSFATFFKKSPNPQGVMSALSPPKMFHGSSAQSFHSQYGKPMTFHAQQFPSPPTQPLPYEHVPHTIKPMQLPPTIRPTFNHRHHPVLNGGVPKQRSSYTPFLIYFDDDNENDAVQPPSPKPERDGEVSPTKSPLSDGHEDPTMPPDEDEDTAVALASMLSMPGMPQETVVEESDDDDYKMDDDNETAIDVLGGLARSNSQSSAEDEDEEMGGESPEPVDPKDDEYKESRRKSSGATTTTPRERKRGSSDKGLTYTCTVCNHKKTDKQGDIKRQVTRSNVFLYQLVFKRNITCGRVCQECLNEYNQSPCKLCGSNDFRTGTLSLKSDLIPKYEQAFGRHGLQEGKLCRACYGKYYSYTNKSTTGTTPTKRPLLEGNVYAPLSPPVKRVKTNI